MITVFPDLIKSLISLYLKQYVGFFQLNSVLFLKMALSIALKIAVPLWAGYAEERTGAAGSETVEGSF